MRAQGYEDLLSAEAYKGPYWFYWPVAPGDWWYPNIAQADVVRQRAGGPIASPARKEFDRGDLVDIGVSKLRYVEGYSIGIYGGDDHSLSTIDAEQLLTFEQVKAFARALPNPVSHDYLMTCRLNDRPLFVWC